MFKKVNKDLEQIVSQFKSQIIALNAEIDYLKMINEANEKKEQGDE